ncbi:hypothetical protein BGI36_03020 [Snodgrassella communis]|jgi:hypothetical protein|uniref:hypothetical protein n=1 Tax=Snodgrassella communis TaxID=2946699 RepID=UPI000C1F4CC5|nr:hypothetical protein [Snodgrassella communis]PIT23064.1 hypothetical protein BGI36_03020 [Snodgrassella communis]
MGEIFYPIKEYLEDYSIAKIEDRHLFIHEMVHIWQYQMGMWVALRGACSLLVDYEYALTDDKVLSDYGMEQQASIITDYYLLRDFGYDHWLRKTKQKYKGSKPGNKQLVQDLWLKMYKNTLLSDFSYLNIFWELNYFSGIVTLQIKIIFTIKLNWL